MKLSFYVWSWLLSFWSEHLSSTYIKVFFNDGERIKQFRINLEHLSSTYFKISINHGEIIKQFEVIWSIWAGRTSKFPLPWWHDQKIWSDLEHLSSTYFKSFFNHGEIINQFRINLEHLSRSYFKISINHGDIIKQFEVIWIIWAGRISKFPSTIVKLSNNLKRFEAFEQHLFQNFLQPWWNNQSISNKFGAFEQAIFPFKHGEMIKQFCSI